MIRMLITVLISINLFYLAFAQETIEGRWHLVGYEDNVMYQFEDNYRYSIYSMDGTFGGIEDAGGSPNPYIVEEDIIYKETAQRLLLLDIYKSHSLTKPAPVIIFIHGGSWAKGDKKDYLPYCLPFAQKGFVTVSLSYRFSHEAIFPAALEDVNCAIRWLKEHSKEYGIDSSKVALVGGSAGGHLAMMAAYTTDDRQFSSNCKHNSSSQVQAIVNLYGPTDLTTDYAVTQEATQYLMGVTYDENPNIYVNASPITHISAGDPPTLTLHGSIDKIVPIYQGDILDKTLKQNGVALEFVEESLKKDQEVVLEAVKRSGWALQFADKNLKKNKEIVLEAVKHTGFALEFADKSLKKDKEIVLETVKSHAVHFPDNPYPDDADDSLRKDPDILAIVNKKKK